MASKKYGAFWLPQSAGIASDLPPPKHLFPSNLHLKSCAVGIKKGICLVEDGKVYEKRFTKEENKGHLKEIFIQNTIKNISCNDMMGMMINIQGEVFIWGEDSNQSGLFVEPGLFLSENPIKVPQLSEIVQGSLGKTHAAVIDSMGHLFTWGTGSQGELGTLGFTISNQPPQIVESAKIFKAKQVICGPSFTCICTDGCYVYLYGIIGSAHNYTNSRRSSVVRRLSTPSPKKGAGNYPYTLPELEKYSTIFVCCGTNYIATLTDSGEVYVFDDCMDLVKLPVNYGNDINFIASTLEVVYGYSRNSNCMYEWREKVQSMLSTNSDLCDCQLAYWIGRVYSIDSEYSTRLSLISTSSHIAGLLYEAEEPGYKNIATFIDELSPYKRSECTTKLIGSVFDSIDYKMEKNLSLRSSLRSSLDLTNIEGHEDLERLYPKGNNDKTIVKIIQYRNEFERKEKLAKLISLIISPIIKSSFLKIKEFVSVQKMCEKTLSAVLMSGAIGKFYHKYRIGGEAYAFQLIKRFSNLSWKDDSIYDQRKIEGIREIWHEISTLCYKQKLMAFTLIKGREIFCLQRKTAFLTLKQLIKDMNRKAINIAFDKWSSISSFDENKFHIYKLVSLLSKIRTRNLNLGLKSLTISAKEKDSDQKATGRILKKCILLYERTYFKQSIKIWKKNTDFVRINEFNQDYKKRLIAKIIFTRISLSVKRVKSKVFKIIHDYSVDVYYKSQEETLAESASSTKLSQDNNSDFERIKNDKDSALEEKFQTLERYLQIVQLNVLSEAWSSFMEDGKKRVYSIISLPNTTDATSNNTPEILRQDEEMVHMPPIDIFPVRHTANPFLSSSSFNFLSVFPNLHMQLSEKDKQKLEFISPTYSDKFILDLPSEQRSHPMDLEDFDALRTPSSTPTKLRLFNISQPAFKTPEVKDQNETSRSNLFADHSLQRSFDNSDYQKKLIQSMISKPKVHKEKEPEKEKALEVALNSGRPPWKPSSKSAVIEEKKKPLINPTKIMQQYDYGLKERLKFIAKHKARVQTPNSDRPQNYSPYPSLLTLPDSVPSETELFIPFDEKIIFNSDMSFGKKLGDDKRKRISYKKLIKYRKGMPIFEKVMMKILLKVKSGALMNIKFKPKDVAKIRSSRGTENKKKQISWQKRLYILASDSLKKAMRKIFAKRFVAKLMKYR
ncbi:unnamed protein product [Blepharisma stoltei]|uniref:Uncharacterized protein n=1 Tax=Blepharisma stoltei TaxID=1481888 RepID=A0AAU9J663_9CILI|nr:unnamed protein product [Blepharisma stoltei]